MNWWPRAVETPTKIWVAGSAQAMPIGLSANVDDIMQSPEGMSLLVSTTTVVSLRVS